MAIADRVRTDDSPRHAAARFRKVLDHAAEMVTIVDANGIICYQNAASASLLGFGPDELVGRHINALMPREDAPVGLAPVADLTSTGSVGMRLHTLQRKDGTRGRFQVTATNMFDDPDVGGLVVYTRDLAAPHREGERRARQQAAVANFGLWALSGAALPLLETATLDVLTTELELELGALLKVGADCRNLVLCGALGWPPTVIGRQIPGLDAAVLHELSLQRGGPLSLDELSDDPRLSLDGLVPPGRQMGSGLAAVLAGQDGPRGALVVLSEQPRTFSADDRSFVQAIANVLGAAIERTDAESELRQRKHEVRELLEHAADSIFRIDADLRFQYVNPAVERTTGIPVAEFIGKTCGELGQPEALTARWDMALRRVFRSGRTEVVELRWPLLDGERDLEVRLSPETGPDGEILSVLGVAHDVTADRLAEAERTDLYRKLLERDSRLTALVERVLPRQAVRAIELGLLRVSLPLQEPGRALSAREREVLALIAFGRSDRAIAGELILAESTVKFHVKSILRKLDARTRAEAVAVAARLHLL